MKIPTLTITKRCPVCGQRMEYADDDYYYCWECCRVRKIIEKRKVIMVAVVDEKKLSRKFDWLWIVFGLSIVGVWSMVFFDAIALGNWGVVLFLGAIYFMFIVMEIDLIWRHYSVNRYVMIVNGEEVEVWASTRYQAVRRLLSASEKHIKTGGPVDLSIGNEG